MKNSNMLEIGSIARANQEELAQLIRPTRYYNIKAKKLQAFCRHVIDNYDGSLELLFKKELWSLRDELLSIYGIGEETADSILLYAAQKPVFVVDAYTKRIFSRLAMVEPDIEYRPLQRFFMDNIPPDLALYNEYHALIVALGNNYCANKNRCAANVH